MITNFYYYLDHMNYINRSIFRVTLLLFAAFMLAHPNKGIAEQLDMHAIVYPPLVYSEGNDLWGVAPEVVHEIQKMVGDTSPLKSSPWLRAYEQTQAGPMQAIFAIVRIPKREKLFKWVGPVFEEGDYFFKRKNSHLRIRTLDDAKRVNRIAVRKGGYTHQALVEAGFENLDVGPTYDSSFKKLLDGRVDLVLMGERTYYYMSKNAGIEPDMFEPTEYKFNESGAWLAFSPDVPDATVSEWQKALDTLKANGKWDEIMERNFHH